MQAALLNLPPLFAQQVVGKDRIFACARMSDDARTFEMYCTDSSDNTFRATFDEKKLDGVKSSVDKSLSWDKFFKGIEDGFAQRKVNCSRQEGSMQLNVECMVNGKKANFPCEKASAVDGSAEMLTAMQEYYWIRSDSAFKASLIKDIEKSSAGGSDLPDPVAMKAVVDKAAASEQSAKDELAKVEADLAKASSSGAGAPSCTEELSGLNIQLIDYDNDVCLGRIPRRDFRGNVQIRKDVDMNLLRLIKSKFEPRGENENLDNEKWCAVLRPFTASEFTSQMKGLSNRAQQLVVDCYKKIDDWDFDVYTVQGHSDAGSLFLTSYALFHRYGLMKKFNLDEENVIAFLSQTEAGYHPNPYHNSTHAADVLHVLHYIMMPGGLIKTGRLSDEDQFAGLLAALIHDYDHPGINNNFHVKTQSYLARLYNDRSILENHHAAEIFEMMKDPRFDLLSQVTPEQRKDIRETVVEMILATDMGLHAKILGTFKRRFQEEKETADSRGGQVFHRRDDIRLALSMGIKMADISNCGRPEHLYLKWAQKIADEFFMQGDREKNLGLPISPFMDRSQPSMAKGQIAFMNYIVIPLFECISEYLPDMHFTVDHVENNKSYWANNDDSAL